MVRILCSLAYLNPDQIAEIDLSANGIYTLTDGMAARKAAQQEIDKLNDM